MLTIAGVRLSLALSGTSNQAVTRLSGSA